MLALTLLAAAGPGEPRGPVKVFVLAETCFLIGDAMGKAMLRRSR